MGDFLILLVTWGLVMGLTSGLTPPPLCFNCDMPVTTETSVPSSTDYYLDYTSTASNYVYKIPERKETTTTTPPDFPDGICTTAGVTFQDECWLSRFNHLYKLGVGMNNDSSACAPPGCPCAIRCAGNPNPLCVLDTSTGKTETVLNFCNLQCINCAGNFRFLHCGPCGINCEEIQTSVQCLPSVAPQRLCTEPGSREIDRGQCVCTLLFDPVCGIDMETLNMATFGNICTFHCAQTKNSQLVLFYDQWANGTCPCESPLEPEVN